MTLRFHPLAELFPLIEGTEFDDLVTSIKENGQHDPIALLDEMILDGRNRYRACLSAGVEPRFEQFVGKDALAFVMDHNIHRRHLNETQRGLIAAKLATLKRGDVRSQLADDASQISGVRISVPRMSIEQAADLLNVSRDTVANAKTVLRDGTAEEVKSIEQGRAAVFTIARGIRAKRAAAERKQRRKNPSAVGKNPQRIETQRINAQIWGNLRDALNSITSLPLPSDVVAVVRTHDRTGLVDSRIAAAIGWLQEFSDAWCNRDKAQSVGKAAANGNHHDNAGTGHSTS